MPHLEKIDYLCRRIKYIKIMKRLLTALLPALMIVLTAFAQKPDTREQKVIDNIRQRYSEMKDYIYSMGEGANWGEDAEGPDSPGAWPPAYFHVKIAQNLPATGYHEENVRMYYEEVRTSEEEIYPPLRLAFASSKYNFAAREFYEEYLYDKQGKLIFIYAMSPDIIDDKMCELRFYLKGKLVIKTIVKTRRHGEEQFQEEYSGEMVPDEYTEWLDQYIISSQNIQKMFDAVNAGKHL